MKIRSLNGCVAVVAAAVTSTAFAGPDWLEVGNAGELIGDAQFTFGVGPLNTIAGTLEGGAVLGGSGDFADMFVITIVDPAKFSITVANANFNPQLFIFNITLPGEAFGLLANQETESSNMPFIGNMATDNSGAQITMPGVYAIAVSGMGYNPVSNTGEIFNFANPFEVSGPDGPGGTNPHIGWTGVGETGSYVLQLEGAGFYDVPAPGGIVVLAALAAFGGRRRRS